VAGYLHLAQALVELAVVTLVFALMVNKPF
jgi:hypothetical protein